MSIDYGLVLLLTLEEEVREGIHFPSSPTSPGSGPLNDTVEGFHVTSLQQNLPSHAAHSSHVGSHKIWPNSLLLKLHKA